MTLKVVNSRRYQLTPADIVLVCNDSEERIHAHRAILSASSDFFKTLFHSPLEIGKTEFHLGNISPTIFKKVLDFIYASAVEIEESTVLELLDAALFLAIPPLQRLCEDFLDQSVAVSDYVMVFSFAELHNCPRLTVIMQKKMLENADAFFDQPEYLNLTADKLAELIASDDLNIQSEEKVWSVICNWYFLDRRNRITQFLQLIHLIRFPLMKGFSLARIEMEDVTQDPLFSSALRVLLDEARDLLQDENYAFQVSHPRYHLRNACVEKGLVIAGHRDADLELTRNVVIFNPNRKVLNRMKDLPSKATPSILCQSTNGTLYFGSIEGMPLTFTVFSYSNSDAWIQVAKLHPIWKGEMCVIGDHLLAIGRNEDCFMQCFSLSTRKHLFGKTSVPFEFHELKMLIVNDGLYVFVQPNQLEKTKIKTFYCKPLSWNWTAKADSIVERRDVTACVGSSDLVYVLGSCFAPADDNRVEVYCPFEDSWTILANVSNTQIFPALSPFEGKIVWVGRKKCFTTDSVYTWVTEIASYDEASQVFLRDCDSAHLIGTAFGMPNCATIKIKTSGLLPMTS